MAKSCLALRLCENRGLSAVDGLIIRDFGGVQKPEDHEYFRRVNPHISPNPVVEEIFTEYIEGGEMMEM